MKPKTKKPAAKPAPRKATVQKSAPRPGFNKQHLLLLALLAIAVFAVYIPALDKEFINYDDDLYISQNPYIADFTFSNLPQIFGEIYQAQYSPVPTVVYGILNMMVGFEPWLFNLTAILLHIIATLLVYKFIRALGGNFMVSYATAALFGLATIQVETVAWLAAAYKTCIYSIFFLSSLIVYIKYIKTGKIKHLLISLLLFLLSCMSKEQAVALALAVIVVDIWFRRKLLSRKVILEKIPFFLIAAGFGILTIIATQSNKDILISTHFSVFNRIVFACYALCSYLYKLFVPANMSLFYPYPSMKSAAVTIVAPLVLLILIGLWIWAVKKKQRFILFGGLFFVVSLLFSLALQVINVREVVMADRYAYISSIGMYFIAAWGANLLVEKKKIGFPLVAGVFVAFFLVTGYLTFSRTHVWKNTITVMSDAIEKYRFPLAYVNRGYEYRQAGTKFTKEGNEVRANEEYNKALVDYTNAIAVKPDYAMAYHNRGTLYFYTQRDSLAIIDYTKALELDPNNSETWSNRGAANARSGKYDAALVDLGESLKLEPNNATTYTNRALTYEMLGKFEEAIGDYHSFLKLKPNDAAVYHNIGVAYQRMNKFEESIEPFNKAISLDAQGLYYLARSYSYNALGDKAKARTDMEVAKKAGLEINPAYLKMLEE